MFVNFKAYKNPTELQPKLYEPIPIGSSMDVLKEFCLKNWITMSDLYPKTAIDPINRPDIDFDAYVICCAEAPDVKFPWSIFSFSNGNVWLREFYFQREQLIKIDVKWAANEV